MREWVVRGLEQTYTVFASDRYHAASAGVRLYLKSRPETNYNFTTLMGLVSARLVHPEIPGRKLMIYE